MSIPHKMNFQRWEMKQLDGFSNIWDSEDQCFVPQLLKMNLLNGSKCFVSNGWSSVPGQWLHFLSTKWLLISSLWFIAREDFKKRIKKKRMCHLLGWGTCCFLMWLSSLFLASWKSKYPLFKTGTFWGLGKLFQVSLKDFFMTTTTLIAFGLWWWKHLVLEVKG